MSPQTIIPQNAVFALIHDQLGSTLEKVFRLGGDRFFDQADPSNPFGIAAFVGGAGLIEQLSDGSDDPPQITLRLALDVAGDAATALQSDLEHVASALTTGDNPVSRIRATLSKHFSVLAQQRNALAELVADRSPGAVFQMGPALFQGIRDAITASGPQAVFSLDLVGRLQQFIGSDTGAALPLATIVQAVQRSRDDLRRFEDVPRNVERGLLAYFFSRKGYPTIDGTNVVAPVHLADITSALGPAAQGALAGQQLSLPQQLSGVFSKSTAEHYLRDVTRVIVESAYDAGRSLDARCTDVKTRLERVPPANGTPEHTVAKFVSWLRGFGSLAESAAMRAVEVGTQGVSEFQTNPLIAAAAGSFAGTVARKVAQDSFLSVIRAGLPGD